jgi:hypothetical protein
MALRALAIRVTQITPSCEAGPPNSATGRFTEFRMIRPSSTIEPITPWANSLVGIEWAVRPHF